MKIRCHFAEVVIIGSLLLRKTKRNRKKNRQKRWAYFACFLLYCFGSQFFSDDFFAIRYVILDILFQSMNQSIHRSIFICHGQTCIKK